MIQKDNPKTTTSTNLNKKNLSSKTNSDMNTKVGAIANSNQKMSASSAAALVHQLTTLAMTTPATDTGSTTAPLGDTSAAQVAADVASHTKTENNGHEKLESLDESGVTHVSIKSLLLDPTHFDDLKTLIQSRLNASFGETLFEIGLEDDGTSMNFTKDEFDTAFSAIERAAKLNDSHVTLVHSRNNAVLTGSDQDQPIVSITTNTTDESNQQSNPLPEMNSLSLQDPNAQLPYFGHVLIRRHAKEAKDILELRVCVVGNVDAGKSTVLGVLTKSTLDDGRGKARLNLFRHKHEIESGRTSSVGMEIMGFDSRGQVVTPTMLQKPKPTWDDICTMASKVITYLDLAGHEKYLKTTVFGMTGCSPDYVMLIIGSNAGIVGMTKEHLGLALALGVPVFIVITKIDMCPPNVLQSTIQQLTKILKSSGCRKIPMFVKSTADVILTSNNFVSERICPIFQISNVTGQGHDLLQLFLNLLRTDACEKYNMDGPVEYQITDTFSVPGVGTVVSGTVVSGIVHVGDTLLLGPNSLGEFTPTVIKSIQRKRVNVPLASAGHNATFALKKVKRAAIRKGMIMASKQLNPRAVMEFEAEVLVLYHSTTISPRYQAMLHCESVRQTAKIVHMDRSILRTGDRAIVRFRFMQHPEYLRVGSKILFREGRTKGVGRVVRVLYDSLDGHGSTEAIPSYHKRHVA